MKNKHIKRTFLFLQGPHGYFFKQLGENFKNLGHEIHRINFNAGDWVDWPAGFSYKHSIKMWPQWIYNFAKHNHISDVLLYGDCRPFHKVAIQELKKLGIKIHVFEEGYIRPHWITYELDGVNGYSSIRDNLDSIVNNKKYDRFSEEAVIPIKHNMKYLLRFCIRYYFFKWIGILFFPRYKTHRPVNSFYEALIWVKRYFTLKYTRKIALHISKELINSKSPYYLFLMQLTTDFQIREHSKFSSIKQALMKVIYSFVEHALPTTKLVIKNHPLDSGQKNYGRLIKNIEKELGIKNRLIYLDGGNLPELLDHCLGVITINSTAGLQSIHHKKPTKTLGTAIYDHPKLVNNCPLKNFWHDFQPPNELAYLRFRNFLLKENQLNGSFYDPLGVSTLILRLSHKILRL